MDKLKVKKYKPIFDSEKFDFIALINFLVEIFKSYFKSYLILLIIFTVYFFVKSPKHESEISFYTNYSDNQTSSSMSILQNFGGFSSEIDKLNFSISNFLKSDKFLDNVVKTKYQINGSNQTLVEYWGVKHDKIFSINPISTLSNLNRKFSLVDDLSIEDKMELYAKEKLSRSLDFSEDRRTSLQKINVTIRDKDLTLSTQIIQSAYSSILNYSNEVSEVKAKEKIKFIRGRLKDIQEDLTQSENNMLEFLEKNKNITSPNLILQRERIQRDINLYSALFISLSDKLELAKIDENDTTSSIFLLDNAKSLPYKSGRSLVDSLLFILTLSFIISLTYESIRYRKELFN